MMQYKGVELVEVIITRNKLIGEGVPDDPVRSLLQVWTKDGELIVEYDCFKNR